MHANNGNGRDSKGRFAAGHAGGPGRPKRETEAAYLDATRESVTLEQWREIVGKAVNDAIDGDKAAREWLGRHLIGDTSKIQVTSECPRCAQSELTKSDYAYIARELGLDDETVRRFEREAGLRN